MAIISEDDTVTQIVRFDVKPETQEALIDALAGEVERWVSHLPGFVSSTFHASNDGLHVINYAQWQNEEAFRGFIENPESHRLQAAVRSVDPSYKPQAIRCRVVRSIGPHA